MNNFNYKKKYHYMVKYLVIALPILCTLCYNLFIPDNANYTQAFEMFVEFFGNLLNLDISLWYTRILAYLFGSDLITNLVNPYFVVIVAYPLYIFYVYVFDLILDVFVFIPKLFHKFFERVGGYN